MDLLEQVYLPEAAFASTARPIHRAVYEAIHHAIQTGAFPAGSKLPTQQELAAQYHVSRPTVIRALHDLTADGLIQARQGAGSFVRPSIEAPLNVGLILPGVDEHRSDSIFGAITHQLVHEATRLGWQVLLSHSSLQEEHNAATSSPVELARRLIACGIRAAILSPHEVGGHGDAFNHNVLSEFNEAGISVVLLDRDIVDYPKRSKYDLVCMDNEAAGESLGRHMIKQGMRRMIFISERLHFPTPRARLQGIRRALAAAEIDFPEDRVCIGNPADISFLHQSLQSHKPDGIVCDNDGSAAAVMQNLDRLKIKVPSEIMIGAFDNAPISNLLNVPLTTVAQPISALAFKTVETLRDRMDRRALPACTVFIHGQLIPRRSTNADR